jgi:peptidoglycan/xylan/chitin deacetylase (PgdA/CDA1 family)
MRSCPPPRPFAPSPRASFRFAVAALALAACTPSSEVGGPASGTGGSGSGGVSGSGTGGVSGGGTGGVSGGPVGGMGMIVDPACGDGADSMAPSIDPPGGLTPDKVPMFVMMGFDDNAYSDGINWVLDTFRSRQNPDGTAARATFFISAGFASEFFNPAGGQTEADVLNAWKKIKADGHEIANHSWSHAETLMGADLATWQAEITKANDLFTKTLGIEQCKVSGFRTPFLGFNQATFDAIRMAGFIKYDTSVEFGYDWWQPPGSDKGWGPGSPESGKHYYWPYTMNQPFPAGFASKGVVPIPGVWEFPIYTFNKMISADMTATVTGFDFNLWTKCQSDSTFNFTEVLKNSLDQRLAGNRSPLSIGAHSDIYSQWDQSANSAWTTFNYQQRRKALLDFIDYAQTKPEVRLVTFRQLIAWLRHPTPL